MRPATYNMILNFILTIFPIDPAIVTSTLSSFIKAVFDDCSFHVGPGKLTEANFTKARQAAAAAAAALTGIGRESGR